MSEVSIILPVGDVKPSFLKKAIQSIVGQTFKDWEMIVVLDHSSTKIRDLVHKYSKDPRIKPLHNSQKFGLTRSVNRAAKFCKGKYIARMDADDIAQPDRLKIQHKFMEENPRVQLCGSWVLLIDPRNKIVGEKRFVCDWNELKKSVFRFNPLVHPTWFLRRSFWIKERGFKDFFRYSQDHEFLLRTIRKNEIVNVNHFLLQYRVNEKSSISIKKLKSQQWFGLIARVRAIQNYGYPIYNIVFLVKPLISFLSPRWVNLMIYKIFYWT